jgi:hypothetical protein
VAVKKPKAHDWKARNLEDWNTHTFMAYLKDKHEELFGIPYVSRNIKQELGNLKYMIKNYGPVATKEFIDECFRSYTPTPQYPGLSFWFMFTYMKLSVLPRVLEKKENKGERRAATVTIPKVDDVDDWL